MMEQKIFKLYLNRLKCRFIVHRNWSRLTALSFLFSRGVQYGTSSTSFKDLYLSKDTMKVWHYVSNTVLLLSEIKKRGKSCCITSRYVKMKLVHF